jgi:repressor of nif and glnA expression
MKGGAPVLTKVEQAILEILESHDGEEIDGRDLRGLLRRRGFRRSAPALVFTMMSLEDKGLVACREEVRDGDGVEVRDRYYRLGEDD